MPVKVVSDKPVRTKRIVCGKCSYELEYTGEDIIYGDECRYIKCPRPSCTHQNFVKEWKD